MIYRYLDCGDIHNGFARVKCKDCNHEYLMAFFCKYCCFQLAIFIAFLSSVPRTRNFDTLKAEIHIQLIDLQRE